MNDAEFLEQCRHWFMSNDIPEPVFANHVYPSTRDAWETVDWFFGAAEAPQFIPDEMAACLWREHLRGWLLNHWGTLMVAYSDCGCLVRPKSGNQENETFGYNENEALLGAVEVLVKQKPGSPPPSRPTGAAPPG